MYSSRSIFVCLAVCIAAGLWGLYWLPQRWLEQAGLTGGWGTIAQYLVSTALLIPWAYYRFYLGKQTGLNLVLAGTLMGGGIVCYANSLLLTDLIRTMLLFYMTPLWATLIELAILRQRPGWWRMVSLPLSLVGVSIVIGGGTSIPVPSNAGDWLALTGGAVYAAGAVKVQTSRIDGIFPILFAFFFYGSLIALCQAVLLADNLGSMPSSDAWLSMAPWLLLLSVLFFIPTNAVISWAPTQISAGLFSILILSEIIFGTISAAFWANEKFGWHEVLGSVCIVTAGLLEVVLSQKKA